MSVPSGRRKQSKFEAPHQFFKLRAAVTELMLLDFGFSEKKYLDKIEHYRQNHENANNVDEVVERYKKKLDSFNSWFIDKECDAILDLVRKIGTEFTLANSIYPSYTPARQQEISERRIHLDLAIAQCYALKQEINYVIGVLPVDLNKYERFDEMINRQIALFKGVREADKRFLKNAPSEKPENYGVNKNKKSVQASHIKDDKSLHSVTPTPISAANMTSTIDVSKFPTYQDFITSQNQLIQHARVPNTAKMNTSSFSSIKQKQDTSQQISPDQLPPYRKDL